MAGGSSFTDEELAELGVTRKTDEYGRTMYEVPCAVCGRPVGMRNYSTTRVTRCEFCKKRSAKSRKAEIEAAKEMLLSILADDLKTDYKHLKRFETGTEKFGDAYLDSIDIAREAIDKFDSVPEVVACVELVYIGARVIVHQKIGSFTVDFCLPDEKVIVEIDGSLYHKNRAKQDNRDHAITYMLDGDWTIRHVPADSITKDHEAFGRSMKKLLNGRRRDAGMDRLKHR